MTEERIMKGMIRTIVEKNNKNFGDKKQVYVKYGGDECKFVFLKNNMVRLIKEKIYFGPFQVLLDDINTEILLN